ncbi:hypothetical protein ACFL47_06210 [Candidatus Latescibacterota bacterium]
MNWFVIIAGLAGAFTTAGHFAVGSKDFLRPMLEAQFDPVPKKVMHCVFHYISAYLILSTIALLGTGFGVIAGDGTTLLVRFIAINYAVFAVWQIVLAATSEIDKGIFKLFQWVFFTIIAVMSWLGA